MSERSSDGQAASYQNPVAQGASRQRSTRSDQRVGARLGEIAEDRRPKGVLAAPYLPAMPASLVELARLGICTFVSSHFSLGLNPLV